jgi:hypothetical protein
MQAVYIAVGSLIGTYIRRSSLRFLMPKADLIVMRKSRLEVILIIIHYSDLF